MSHHTSLEHSIWEHLNPEEARRNEKLLESVLRNFIRSELGPTGAYPHGKISPQDEGEIKIALCSFNGCVTFDFGKPIRSLGFEPKQAREIAALMLTKADEAEKMNTVRVIA